MSHNLGLPPTRRYDNPRGAECLDKMLVQVVIAVGIMINTCATLITKCGQINIGVRALHAIVALWGRNTV